ncbi:MAG TPA: hypothetical protein VK794_09310 [Steroidobacteraceae bacterium]|jgi:hypothetical protein|nr:hypothetical protein [Steroidobacteraceae bacterium]
MRELLFGSALLMSLSYYAYAASPPNGPILTDRIYAISTVSPESAKAVGVNYPHPIAVLGEKHTYIVGIGSDEIAKLANMPQGKIVLKDKKTLYLDGGRLSGSMNYEVIGSYSANFQVNGVAIPPAPLNGVNLQDGATIVNFYKGSATSQPSPMKNATVTILKAPLVAGAFLTWAVVDLTFVTVGVH